MSIEVTITPAELGAITGDDTMLKYMRVRLVQAGVPAVIRGIELNVQFGKLDVSADHTGMTYRWTAPVVEGVAA